VLPTTTPPCGTRPGSARWARSTSRPGFGYARGWHRHTLEFQTELAAARPPGDTANRLARRRAAIAAIEAELVHLSLFFAHRRR
jgi:hypothetical protein